MTEHRHKFWAVLWRQENRLEGKREHLVHEYPRCGPLLFRTRREAREYAKREHGYISRRPDLRHEPHGWKPAKVVKVECTYRTVENGF